MKRIFMALLATATLFAGCTKSDVDEGLSGKVQLKLTSSIAPTRATDIAFEEGDLVGLYIDKGETTLLANEKMTAYASGNLEAAQPIYYPEDGAAIDLFAYYPWVENPTNPTAWTIPSAQNEMTWTSYDLCSGSVTGVTPRPNAVPVVFNHLMAKVTLDLTVQGAGITDEQKKEVSVKLLASVSATVNTRTGEVTDVAEPVEITSAEGNIALVVPQSIAKDSKIATIETPNGNLDVMVGKDVVLEAGKNNIVKLTLTINEYMTVNVVCSIADWNEGSNIELNKPVVAGDAEDLSENGLANSYIVSEAGNYSIAAKQLNGTLLSGAKADWVWMTEENLISDVSYDNDAIVFKTSGNEGNGVIALLDDAGNIVWSWHIWCTDVPADQKWNEYTWMDRNMGATSAEAGVLESYGLLYQWGRKDPFIGANQLGDVELVEEETPFTTLTATTIVNENVVGEGNGWAYIKGQSTVEKSVLYPMCFYNYNYVSTGVVGTNPAGTYGGETTGSTYGASTNPTMADWCEGGASDRWYNTSVTSSGKTLNDPCPAGYMVPTQTQQYADFYGEDGSVYFLPETRIDNTYGRKYETNGISIWLPTPGFRAAAVAKNTCLRYVGNSGFYWNSDEYSTASIGSKISIASGNVARAAGSMWKCYGFSVRCVKEGEAVPPVVDNAVDLSAEGTSNCYIVNTPGTYKFNATVMGNGKATSGITPKTLAPASARLSWQQMAAGKYGGSTSNYGTEYGDLKSVVVRTSVEVNNGYIYFDTPEVLSPSNAVIDALDSDGNIIWSWHIWVAPGFDAVASAKTINTSAVTNVVMMDRNLGAYGNGEAGETADIQAARGLVYQWGRKDPFFTTNVGNWKYANYWDYETDAIAEMNATVPTAASTDLFTDATYDVNKVVDYTIKNPRVFVTGPVSNGYSWIFGTNKVMSFDKETLAANWGHLWGNTVTGKDECTVVGAGSKSIYDPCPLGWRVPENGAFKFFTVNGEAGYPAWRWETLWKYNCSEAVSSPAENQVKITTSAGFHFYYAGEKSESSLVPTNSATIYFPGVCARTYSGTIAETAVNIELMTNHACRNTDSDANLYKNGRAYFTDSGNSWYTDSGTWYNQQACAMPVRCIKE